ncbi:hypothetical protein scyTo_0018579 [Scyliorhinus torazame]|uniref:SSD domain-containing protein n=1 Tax=Scyliorhinus torazame TaxID=75743 RepID=A0A401PYQ4_SCYTO|nr:hypothetical protein [Scyliorhinus torazame]
MLVKVFTVLLSLNLRPFMAACTSIHQAGHCAFYEDCGKNPEVSGSLLPARVPCVYNGPALKVSGQHLELLKTVCPMLYTGAQSTHACCSMKQLNMLDKSLSLSKTLLSRCPSCVQNFINLYCQNTCSPNQSLHINVTRTFNSNDSGIIREAVLEYQCYYGRRFADGAFNSCKNVRIPSTGGFAIAPMCGKYGSLLCNTERWLSFQGDSSNGLAPLDIEFVLLDNETADVDGGIVPYAGNFWRCNESTVPNGQACSCLDCVESCPVIPTPTPAPGPWTIGALDGALAVCLAAFGLSALLFATFLISRCHMAGRSRAGAGPPKSPQLHPVAAKWSHRISGATQLSLTRTFRVWGTMVARYPIAVICIALALVVVMSAGLVFLTLTTNPVELWSAPNSRARREKDFHDANFGPFFRTNQIIITAGNHSSYTYDSVLFGPNAFSGIFSKEIILELLDFQTRLQAISVWSKAAQRNITIKDICYAPLKPHNPRSTDCAVNSLLQYFQNNRTRINAIASQTMAGITGTVDWRDHFLYCIKSLEDEINRTTAEDIPIFAISYLVIFVYIALALGEYTSWRTVMIDSKVTLGLGGVLVVLGAVLSSMGFYAYIGVPSSLIILEVVPFLVLAVGADNIFILVLQYQRDERQAGERREEQIGRVLGDVAPSMLLCSFSESICFFLGALTKMPAVRTFALYAALAVFFDFLLQMTAFVALMSLDARREEKDRFDICCCAHSKQKRTKKKNEGLLLPFMREHYAPFLLHPVTSIIVIVLFLFMLCTGIFLMLHVRVGLDQELALPADSYMLKYFAALNKYFEVGVPVYFVTTAGYNFTTVDGMNGICSSVGCDNNSMTQKIQYATEFPQVPTEEEFNQYLPIFLDDAPILQCSKGGLGAYGNAVKRGENGEILASRFMAYHTPLKNSQEYTAALKVARELAANITDSMRRIPGTDPNFEVFPYTAKRDKVERAKEATAYMGSAVFAGVAMTNLPGIIVLYFAQSQLIQIFFFRLNLVITLLGLLHGLVFLPVLLSYFGPDVSPAATLQQRTATESLSGKIYSNSYFQNFGFEGPADGKKDQPMPQSNGTAKMEEHPVTKGDEDPSAGEFTSTGSCPDVTEPTVTSL